MKHKSIDSLFVAINNQITDFILTENSLLQREIGQLMSEAVEEVVYHYEPVS